MAGHHQPLRHTFGTRRTHKILAEHLHDAGSRLAHNYQHRARCQYDGRQDRLPRKHAIPSPDSLENGDLKYEYDQKDRSDHIGRDRTGDDRTRDDRVVNRCILLDRSQNPEQNGENSEEDQRPKGQLRADRQTAEDHLPYTRTRAGESGAPTFAHRPVTGNAPERRQRLPPIAPKHGPHVVEKLDHERPVQAERFLDLRIPHFVLPLLTQHGAHRIDGTIVAQREGD